MMTSLTMALLSPTYTKKTTYQYLSDVIVRGSILSYLIED